jgi:hypothetical protein
MGFEANGGNNECILAWFYIAERKSAIIRRFIANNGVA